MTIEQLIDALFHFPMSSIVMAYDADSETEEEVTGLLFESRENHETSRLVSIIHICTDDNS